MNLGTILIILFTSPAATGLSSYKYYFPDMKSCYEAVQNNKILGAGRGEDIVIQCIPNQELEEHNTSKH